MTYQLWIFFIGALVITKAQDLDLSDAIDDLQPTQKPEQPPKIKDGDDLQPTQKPEQPPKIKDDPKQPAPPPESGGFSDADLLDGKDIGNHGGDQFDDSNNDQPKESAVEGGQMAGIISAVAVAVFGAASSYFAYQKKKLCFKIQGGTDPESGRNQSGTQSDPQVFSNLLRLS